MSANTILTSIVTGGTNTHTTTAEEANALATDFVTQGVVGAITLNTGSGGTGSFCVNADASPDMGVTVKAGQAYITATPSGQNSQVLRARAAADYTAYTINANTSGSTKYDWIYLKVDPTAANNPAADASDVASIYTSRSSSNSTDNGSPPTYGLLLAVITVANGASSITNSNITDKRFNTSIGAQNGSLIVNQQATGDPAIVQAAGIDANVDIEIIPKGTGSVILYGSTPGWTNTNETWTYSSYDSTNKTGVITVPTDATAKYSAGMRVRFTNNSATQYGIITKVAATALTVYFGTDYSLTNSAITNPYYSVQKAPFGFPLDPAKWTAQTLSTADVSQNTPGTGWYNLGSLSLSIPIGSWRVSYQAVLFVTRIGTGVVGKATLSTNSATETDPDFTTSIQTGVGSSSVTQTAMGCVTKEKPLTLSSATTYYLNGSNSSGSSNSPGLQFQGASSGTTIIKAVCAYL